MWHAHFCMFFTFECQLPQIEWLLFFKVFFRVSWAVIGQSETLDKQHGEVRCGEIVRWKDFYVNWSSEVLWMLLLCHTSIIHEQNGYKLAVTNHPPFLFATFVFEISSISCCSCESHFCNEVFLRKWLVQVTFARNFQMCVTFGCVLCM